ncbi:MAG: hypothetical protein K1X88_30235 [Nannocystaceae bacterium]|nr:hypothetical protein [Nannocystaceae bacterium]
MLASAVATPQRTETSPPWVAMLALALVAAIWAWLRISLNREYGPASWQTLIELRAPLPFGHRVLVPALLRPLVDAGVSIPWAFGLSEWLATITVVTLLRRVLADELPPRAATLGAVLLLPVLTPALLLQHRWPIFYPWDAWAMVALLLGCHALRRGNTPLVFATVIVGAFNRESVVLLPLCAVALRLGREPVRTTIARAVLLGFAYAGARALLPWLVPAARGAPLHLWVEGQLRLWHNLAWLAVPANAAQWCGSISVLPAAWWAVRRHVPADLQRLQLPLLLGLAGLLVVANAYEPRVYGELMVLAWAVVWIGAWRWAHGDAEPAAAAPGSPAPWWLRALDRWGALALLSLLTVTAALAWSLGYPARP